MTLDDAIIHCDEIYNTCPNRECANEHKQLKEWLEELKERRDVNGSLRNLRNM